jgi:DNA-directed RNA polymerase specialized sigma24 family protein
VAIEGISWPDIIQWCNAEIGYFLKRSWLQEADVAEVRQDAYLRVHRSLSGFSLSGKASLKTWVQMQAHYACLDFFRERGRGPDFVPTGGGPDDGAPFSGFVNRASLSPEQRACLLEWVGAYFGCRDKLSPTLKQRHMEDIATRIGGGSRRENAERVGIRLDTLKKSIARARVIILACLKKLGFRAIWRNSAPLAVLDRPVKG